MIPRRFSVSREVCATTATTAVKLVVIIRIVLVLVVALQLRHLVFSASDSFNIFAEDSFELLGLFTTTLLHTLLIVHKVNGLVMDCPSTSDFPHISGIDDSELEYGSILISALDYGSEERIYTNWLVAVGRMVIRREGGDKTFGGLAY